MKTIMLGGALVSIFYWSRNVDTESNYPTPIKVYGKISPSFDFEKKKNDPNYRDILQPAPDFKTLFIMYSGPNPKGDGC